jgi:Putative peptidoglycan binding domain
VPRKVTMDDDELPPPRRRRAAAAAAVEEESERGLLMRMLLHSPKDMVAGLLAFTAAGAIIANALFLQHGPHPAPMFGSVVHIPPVGSSGISLLLPRPRPHEADASSTEPRLAETKPSELRLSDIRAAEPKSGDPRSVDPLGNLVKATTIAPPSSSVVATAPSANVPRPPAPVPPVPVTGSRRVAAVQRVLTEYGYGQLRATGTIGADTQAAIQKFERERKLPVTGQVSDRLVRELAVMIGHPVD